MSILLVELELDYAGGPIVLTAFGYKREVSAARSQTIPLHHPHPPWSNKLSLNTDCPASATQKA